MSTIELVDPELRDALALWPLLPLTAESLTQRRANALDLIGAVPKPNLPISPPTRSMSRVLLAQSRSGF
jgi:hypothetical protein